MKRFLFILVYILSVVPSFATTICDQTACKTGFDTIPRLDLPATIASIKDGAWMAPTTWDQHRLPTASDRVQITHAVLYDVPNGEAGVIGISTAAGSLTFETTHATRLIVDTILVLPQGTLTRHPGGGSTEIIFRDTPIDAIRDSSQYGNGLVVIDGTVTLIGMQKDPSFLRVAVEPKAGDRTLTLAQAPTGWTLDRVLIPDTRQLTDAETETRTDLGRNIHRFMSQSEVKTLTTITGAILTLDTPLAYAHSGARDAQGHLDLLPHVAHLASDFIIRSANPTGTRGHVLFTGASDVTSKYVVYRSLGRTKAEPLDSTTFDSNGAVTHIGTNQIGRYPLHMHHVPGTCTPKPYQFTLVGNVIEEAGRWGIAVHGSSFGLVQDNIVYNVKGAGIVTEDGSELENIIDHNFVARVENTTPLTALDGGIGADPFGRLGNGFWFRGPGNIVRNNVVADTREGYGWYTGASEQGTVSPEIPVNIPKYPCADTTVPGQYTTLARLILLPNREITGNESYSTSLFGMGYWFFNNIGAPLKNMTIWHGRDTALFFKYGNATVEGLTIRNQRAEGIGINQFNNLDARPSSYSTLDVQGVDTIYTKTGQLALAPSVTFTNGVFASKNGFVLPNQGQDNQTPGSKSTFIFRNLRFMPIPGFPLTTFQLPWSMHGDNNGLMPHVFTVYSYQGNPQDNFHMFYTAQDPAAPAPVGDPNRNPGGCPEKGITNQQCFDKYKIAAGMELAPCTDTITHPEIIGFTCPITTGLAPQGTPTFTLVAP